MKDIIFNVGFGVLGLIALFFIQKIFIGIRFIGSDELAVVEKWWSPKGKLSEGKFIALDGEAGYQADILRTGMYFKPALIYKIHKTALVTIPQGQLGYVFSRDGEGLKEGQRFARKVDCNDFQDIRKFLANKGEKGTQLTILREGIYPINLANFIIFTSSCNYYLSMDNPSEEKEIAKIASELGAIDAFRPVVIDGNSDNVGIVTIHEGPSLSGQIIAPIVGDNPKGEDYHSNFQNPTKFLDAGGFAGRQLQVLTEGTYYLNKKFCSVELSPKTVIGMGYVGVVNSFVGDEGEDLSGDDYKHGELVEKNCRGVWETPLATGKYAINNYAMTISHVPTTNFMLQWDNAVSGNHKFDENLCSIALITKDAFEPTLPLSVVVNIASKKAPLVIQRFGDIKKLIDQTLDPMVSAYFKNIAQKMTMLELISSRSEIQETATKIMKEKFQMYNLELVEVLIGTPSSNNDKKIIEMLNQLSDRQLSEEQVKTYASKMKSAEREKELREFEAKAKEQTMLTESSINIQIQENQGSADLIKAKKDAEKTKAIADADAYKIKVLAEAESIKISKIGMAEAMITTEKVNAYGGPQYQVVQEVMSKMAQAIENGGMAIVPQNVVTMGGAEGGNTPNAFEGLMTMLLSEKVGVDFKPAKTNEEPNKIVEDMKKSIIDSLNKPVETIEVEPVEIKEPKEPKAKKK